MTAPGPPTAGTSQGPRTGQPLTAAFAAGAGVGVLGGMIGLGGAEFRLPLLITVFGFAALPAVIVNKAMSLVVVATALPACPPCPPPTSPRTGRWWPTSSPAAWWVLGSVRPGR